MRKLLPWQVTGAKYLQVRMKAALFWEMRLGKSVVTVNALKNTPGMKLVVCPKTNIQDWIEELKIQGCNFLQWHVMNYESLKNYPWQPDVIILDESVKIKNPKAGITKLLLKNFRDTSSKILLSGNPAPNSPLEYFTQMQFLYGSWLGCNNYWQFRQRYFSSDYMGHQWWPKPGTKETIRKALEHDAFVLTRKQVGIQSRKIYERRFVEMPPKLKKIYRKMEEEFVADLPEGKELEVDHVLVQLNYLQQMASGIVPDQEMFDFKAKEVANLLEGELKGEPVVIWTTYRKEQFLLGRCLLKTKLIFEEINGSSSMNDRKEKVAAFKRGNIDVLIISTACGKYGLNLSKSSTSIYFSNSYSLDNRIQSEERIFNVNKNELLLYVDIITKDTVQEEIVKALRTKTTNSRYFTEGVIDGIKRRL